MLCNNGLIVWLLGRAGGELTKATSFTYSEDGKLGRFVYFFKIQFRIIFKSKAESLKQFAKNFFLRM